LPATPASASAEGAEEQSLKSLARLPAVEIVRLARGPGVAGLSLPKADVLVVQATDAFVDSLRDKPVQQQKQALGDKLFKVLKSFGIKGAVRAGLSSLWGALC
jgi:polyadenylate-binding protein